MKKTSVVLFTIVSSVTATFAIAHGGHGRIPGSSLIHYLIEPMHSLQAFVPLACIAVTVWLLRRARG